MNPRNSFLKPAAINVFATLSASAQLATYTFESLTNGPFVGQDGWIAYGDVTVRPGTGVPLRDATQCAGHCLADKLHRLCAPAEFRPGTTNWVNATNAVSIVGTNSQVIISPLIGNGFFRLMHP